ncbi:unnamed protein product [Oikopleura dioica]|uniref:EGF-like domain-containing protein n=1 Tax=Oikopleura dioica TaxID=34765 RepID=E4YDC0_OIKDI|nr:unnamed protein product [Oikopleura dioica]
MDVDECADSSTCSNFGNTTCNNSPGSYSCDCIDNYKPIQNEIACEDIDECTDLSVPAGRRCDTLTTNCVNMPGIYDCPCKDGYQTITGNEFKCRDIDECKTEALIEQNCGINMTCTNSPGSFICECDFSGHEVDETALPKICKDINECHIPDSCPEYSSCTNFDQSYSCSCDDGFSGGNCTGDDCRFHFCEDIDECAEQLCDESMECENLIGSHSCFCRVGLIEEMNKCLDINECLEDNSCPEHSSCLNAEASFSCICDKGFYENTCEGLKACKNFKCEDINECNDDNLNVCDVSCLNQPGNYTCECPLMLEKFGFGGCREQEVEIKIDSDASRIVTETFSILNDKIANITIAIENEKLEISEGIDAATNMTRGLLKKMLNPSDINDIFLHKVTASNLDLAISYEPNAQKVLDQLENLLTKIHVDVISTDNFHMADGNNMPNFTFDGILSKRSSQEPVICQIDVNPFIYTKSDLKLEQRFLFVKDYSGNATVTAMDRTLKPERFTKKLRSSKSEIIRFDLIREEDFFVHFSIPEHINLEVWLEFWKAPQPEVLKFRNQYVISSRGKPTSASCTDNTCFPNKSGIHLSKEDVASCFSRTQCSIFLQIYSPEDTEIKIHPFSKSCVADKSKKWGSEICKVESESSFHELRCSCQIEDQVKLAIRTGEFNTNKEYSSIQMENILEITITIFPLILIAIWLLTLGMARKTDRQLIRTLQPHPVTTVDKATAPDLTVIVLESYYLVERAPNLINLQILYLDLLELKKNHHVTLGRKDARIIENGGRTVFVCNMPIMSIISVKLWVDFSLEKSVSFRPKSLEIRRLGKYPNKAGVYDLRELSFLNSFVIFDENLSLMTIDRTISNDIEIERRSQKSRLTEYMIEYNNWFGINFRKQYSNFNCQTRIILAGFSLSLAILLNQLFYIYYIPGEVLLFGKFLLSFSLVISVPATQAINIFITMLIRKIFNKLQPEELSDSWTENLRKFIIFIILAAIAGCLSFVVLNYSKLNRISVEIWYSSVYISCLFETIITPSIISILLYVFNSEISQSSTFKLYFPANNPAFYNGLYERLPPTNQLSRREITKIVNSSNQREDLIRTTFKFVAYVCLAGSLYLLSKVIVPEKKFYVDWNFRKELKIENGLIRIDEMWDDIKIKIPQIMHRDSFYNDDLLTFKEQKFASDFVNFRLGPASLIQYRSECGIYDQKWIPVPEPVPDAILIRRTESPSHLSWLSTTRSSLPDDVMLKTGLKLSGCDFFSELGTSRESAEFMINELFENAWVDGKTELVIFEQSFLNMNINSFIQVRIIYEFQEGGAIFPSLSIQQFKNVELSNTILALSLSVFSTFLLYEIFTVGKILYYFDLTFVSVFQIVLCLLDGGVFAIYILRTYFLASAIEHFVMDPKGNPKFADVFLLQFYFISLVAVSLFLHTLFLIHILSTLTIVRSKFNTVSIINTISSVQNCPEKA